MRFVLILPFVLMMACSGSTENSRAPEVGDAGKGIYQAYCISCHNPDPKFDGAIGPAIYGSSRELLEARLKNSSYPPGYNPKRPSQVMTPMPHVLKNLDELVLFLNP